MLKLGYDKVEINTLNEADFSKHLSFTLEEKPQREDFIPPYKTDDLAGCVESKGHFNTLKHSNSHPSY